jgi:hypothetical protein
VCHKKSYGYSCKQSSTLELTEANSALFMPDHATPDFGGKNRLGVKNSADFTTV